MRPAIKVCGVNDAAFAAEAELLGADYLGFIFAEGSPRRVGVADVVRVRARLSGRARCVGVFTTATVPEILGVVRTCGLDVVQLHRRATAADVAALRAAGLEVWTLAGGAEGDAVIFDTSHGDGETKLRRGAFRTVLAGGVSAENLSEFIARRPDVIDVSGSLETSPGVKSAELLRELFAGLTRTPAQPQPAAFYGILRAPPRRRLGRESMVHRGGFALPTYVRDLLRQ